MPEESFQAGAVIYTQNLARLNALHALVTGPAVSPSDTDSAKGTTPRATSFNFATVRCELATAFKVASKRFGSFHKLLP